MKNLIALVGRPNVGKSTLFNRLTRSRDSLVDDTPGLTRDRKYQRGTWQGRAFNLVDTGGFSDAVTDGMCELIREQALVAIEEADAIILVTDGQAGVTPDDLAVAELLRRTSKPVVCAVNKCEKSQESAAAVAFYELGLEHVFPVSALYGGGMSELMEPLLSRLDWSDDSVPVHPDGIPVAVIGYPNVGKSSLINALVGEERLITSPIPGTTRDCVDVILTAPDGQRIVLIDTAGLRRKNRVALRVEKFSALAALRAIDRARVAVLVLNPERGIADQDRRIAEYAEESGCGLVFVVNKWDLAPAGYKPKFFEEQIAAAFPRLGHVPVALVSAKTGKNVGRILTLATQVYGAAARQIPTAALNRWLRAAVETTPPPRVNGRLIKMRYTTQLGAFPPSFVIFCNLPEAVDASYARYLENQMRAEFKIHGVPIKFKFRGGDNPYAPKHG